MCSRTIRAVFAFLAFFIAPLPSSARSFESQRIIISSESREANSVGEEIYRRGGNVADVTVALALALSVTNPAFGSLGGGGFAMVKLGKEVQALDFRETAPTNTDAQFFLGKPKEASLKGGTAVAVPGLIAGLWELHQKYGRLKWNELFEGAIRLAEKGATITSGWEYEAKEAPFNSVGKQLFLGLDGKPLKPGDRIVQKKLAAMLRRIKAGGPKAFYEGSVAGDIVQTIQQDGGVLSLKDLKDYAVRWRKPIDTAFQGYTLYLMPPPSSGGVVLRNAFQLMERANLSQNPFLSVNELHFLAEVQSRSFRDRSLLGDPDFFQNPMEAIFSAAHLEEMSKSILLEKKTAFKPAQTPPEEGGNTGHFNVMDHEGHAVAMTTTLNGFFGSGLVTPTYGIVLNNEMDDFTTRPGQPNQFGLLQGEGNVVGPMKRPLSSMSPTLVEKDGRVVLALGAPGGPRIISGVFQTLVRLFMTKLDLDEALNAPRVHHQFLPDVVLIDRQRFSPEVRKGLEEKGHKLKENDPFNMGRVSAVRWNERSLLEGSWDRRGEGVVSGY